MTLRLYNTMGRQKVEFDRSLGSKVGVYTCGPTVYHYAHIGNMRAYIAWDVLRRVLEREKYKPTHVMNITDVGHLQADADDTEDKLDKAAREEKKSPQQIAEFYTKAFFADMEKLRILRPTIVCKATDHIPDMIKLIQKLEKKGFTYTTPHAVYFDVSKFKNYTKFSGQSLKELKGVREDVERDSFKKHPADFRLWQLNQPSHILQWDSPWGKGYPGWHIECSAMSMKYLGETIDIHTGGMDHIPIHHTNEIAQSEAATGKKYVNIWLHNAFMQIDKNKMSKSLKNIYTLADLEKKGFDALDYRYLLLTTHYRSELNFTWGSFEGVSKNRKRFNDFIHRLQKYKGGKANQPVLVEIEEVRDFFKEKLNDDLDTPAALTRLLYFMSRINKVMDHEDMSKADSNKVLKFLGEVNEIFAVFDFSQEETPIPAHVLKLAQDREKARNAKDWKKADSLRVAIAEEGFLVTDTKDGFDLAPS